MTVQRTVRAATGFAAANWLGEAETEGLKALPPTPVYLSQHSLPPVCFLTKNWSDAARYAKIDEVIMMILVPGRPAADACAGRSAREIRCYDFLDSLGVAYERVDHDAAENMAVCEEIDRVLDAMICKNLFLCNRQQTDFYLLMIPGDKTFKTKDLSHQLGVARLSFGSADKMAELLDVHPGSVSVLALMNDPENRVRLLIDEDVRRRDFFGCHPCENTSSLRLKMSDLTDIILPALHHEPTYVTL